MSTRKKKPGAQAPHYTTISNCVFTVDAKVSDAEAAVAAEIVRAVASGFKVLETVSAGFRNRINGPMLHIDSRGVSTEDER